MIHLKRIDELFDVLKSADVQDFKWLYKTPPKFNASMWVKAGGSYYFCVIGLDNGTLQYSFSSDESEDFEELTGRGELLKILSTAPEVVDTFRAAMEAEGFDDAIVNDIMIQPSKTKRKEEFDSTPAINTSRGRIYHAAMTKWLKRYKYKFEDYNDSLVYTFDTPIPLNIFTLK